MWQVRDDEGRPRLKWSERPRGLGRKAATQWVIERSQCIYRCLDMSHVPRAGRAQALALKLPGLSPYRQTGHYAVWRGGMVQLWLWDEQARVQAAEDFSEPVRHYRCIPETLLQAPATAMPCVRLAEVRTGLDLQVWKDGVLLLSIHHAAAPSPEQVRNLLRGIQGLDMPVALPVERLALLPAPWAASAGLTRAAEWEFWLSRGMLAMLLVLCGFHLAQGASWWWGERDLDARQEVLAVQVEPLLSARNRAQQASAEAAEWQRMMQQPSQVELLRRLANLLPNDSQVLKWRFHENELELLIATQRMDPRFFVQRFQDEGGFHDVRVEPSPHGDGLQLAMSLR